MGLEVATHIYQLDSNNPVGATDQKAQGDDHIRMIKLCLQTDFPNIDGVVTASHTELSYVAGVTSAIQTQLNAKQATITGAATTITAANLTADRILVSDGAGKVAASGVAAGSIASGSYTPVATIMTNLASVTNLFARYIRIGNNVSVSGQAVIDPNATGATTFRITLPIASDFTVQDDCLGVVGSVTSNAGGGVYADTSNNQAVIDITELNTAGHFIMYEFMYVIK